MIAMGSIYIKDCAIEPNIPIYLIVAGVTSLIICLLFPIHLCAPFAAYVIETIVGLFALAWFITGSVWVFRHYQTDPRDCNDTLYKFAFGILLFSYASVAFVLVVSCIVVCCGACCGICKIRSEE
ncbi:transmembrane protein 272-like isoform X2 [Engystomops pustulosus]